MNKPLQAEQDGKGFFKSQPNSTYRNAEKYAKNNYNSIIERECFVAGWNQAYWDEQERVLKGGK